MNLSIVLCIQMNDWMLICRTGMSLSIIQMAEKAFIHEVLISQEHTDKGCSTPPQNLDIIYR